MVFSYFGKPATVREMRERLNPSKDGSSARRIVEVAREAGFKAEGRRVGVDDLSEFGVPFIAFMSSQEHFVVVEAASSSKIRMVDPVRGRIVLPITEFDQEFSGVVLLFATSMRRPRRRAGLIPKIPSFIGDLLASTRGLVALFLGTSLAVSALSLFPVFFVSYTLDVVLAEHSPDRVLAIAVACSAVILVRFGVGILRSYCLATLETKFDARLTESFVVHLLRLPLPYFDVRTRGDLLDRLAASSTVRQLVTSQALAIVLEGMNAVIGVALLAFVYPSLALIAMAFLISQIAVTYASSERYVRTLRYELYHGSVGRSVLVEALTAIESVKITRVEEAIIGKWRVSHDKEVRAARRRVLQQAIQVDVGDSVRMALVAAVTLFGAWQASRGEVTIGAVIGGIYISTSLLTAVGTIAHNTRSLQVVTVHLARMGDVLDEPVKLQQSSPQVAAGTDHDIVMTDVDFTYSGATNPTLRSFSIRVPSSSFAVVVGATGSGKSTVVRLAAGVLRPDAGTVRVRGRSVLSVLPGDVKVVPQHAALFSGSIIENFQLAHPSLDEQEIIESCKLAQVHHEISAMPRQYRTRLGDGGSGLSGGQRQRILLAIALSAKPGLLILDEATSDVDEKTESSIIKALRALDCTILMVTHRLAVARAADLVYTMEAGRVIEEGTHDQLVVAGGAYAGLHGIVR